MKVAVDPEQTIKVLRNSLDAAHQKENQLMAQIGDLRKENQNLRKDIAKLEERLRNMNPYAGRLRFENGRLTLKGSTQ